MTDYDTKTKTLNDGAEAAYDREDRAWFTALTTEDLETLWAQVSGPNLFTPAGPWDDEVFDALAERGWFEVNGIYAPGGPKDIWTKTERN